MFFFRRKKKKHNELSEAEKTIAKLKKQMHLQEAQIITFKEDIAPHMGETIKKLREEINKLNYDLRKKEYIIDIQSSMIKNINLEHSIRQKEGEVGLIKKHQDEINDKKIRQQAAIIKDLQKKVNLLPEICSRLMDEINRRNSKILYLVKEIEKINTENTNLKLDVIELEERLEETLKKLEEHEFKTRKILDSILLV